MMLVDVLIVNCERQGFVVSLYVSGVGIRNGEGFYNIGFVFIRTRRDGGRAWGCWKHIVRGADHDKTSITAGLLGASAIIVPLVHAM